MLQYGCNLTVALSGGADSVALLYAMIELKDEYNLSISAVHINHQLRGVESDRDENFCRCLCEKLDIPFFCKRINVKSYMQKSGKSCEESARILRYKAFDEYSEGLIATAHTLSDNAETVIHNLARGTGLKGLTGIPPVRDNIIRPLILADRNDVENYLAEKSQHFMTDRTNLTDDYTRNKIRHHIIPEFQKLNSSFLKTMSSNISALQSEDDYISEMADKAYEECMTDKNTLSGLADYHKAIRSRCIAKFLSIHNLRYSFDRISAIDRLIFSGGKINIAENVYITADMGTIFIEYASAEINNTEFNLPFTVGKIRIFDDKFLNTILTDHNGYAELPNCYAVDYNKLSGDVIVRSRKYGDKIRLAGKNFTSSVKKSLINMKIPSEQRCRLCFLEDSEGLIFAEKIGIAERVKPDSDTSRFLIISFSEN